MKQVPWHLMIWTCGTGMGPSAPTTLAIMILHTQACAEKAVSPRSMLVHLRSQAMCSSQVVNLFVSPEPLGNIALTLTMPENHKQHGGRTFEAESTCQEIREACDVSFWRPRATCPVPV